MGKGVMKAVDNIIKLIAPALIGMDPAAQQAIDDKMVQVRPPTDTTSHHPAPRTWHPAPGTSRPTPRAPHPTWPPPPRRSSTAARTSGAGPSPSSEPTPSSLSRWLPARPVRSCTELPPSYTANLLSSAPMHCTAPFFTPSGAAAKRLPLYKHIAVLAGNPTDKM